MANDIRGSLWNRWDLHFHTPSSYDYEDKSVTNQQIVDSLIEQGIRAVAITDHHLVDVDRINELKAIAGDRLTIFPGIELRAEYGKPLVHYIGIFPEDIDVNYLWTTLQGSLKLTPQDVTDKGGDDRVYVSLKEFAGVARDDLGGVISVHAGRKSNSIEGIKSHEQFEQQIKYDITNKFVDLLEVGQIRDIDAYLDKIFPATGMDKPLIVCSDCHDMKCYAAPAPLWMRADPTFRGLCMCIKEPRDRVFIGDTPPDLKRVDANPTKYIQGISIKRQTSAPAGQKWFDGELPLNTGLVAVVGNKGSGKSALTDTIGLLGAASNADSFSFLNPDRFRNPKSSLAAHFLATMTWHNGDTVVRTLAETAPEEDVERVKYLPQEYVESICTELSELEGNRFEEEIKSVIFSHVPQDKRLGHTNLDDLVSFETDEKQKRIDALIKRLLDFSRKRVALEQQADPAVRRSLESKIAQRESELKAHDGKKPVNPEDLKPESADAADKQSVDELEQIRAQVEANQQAIDASTESSQLSQRRRAVAEKLLKKVDNFEKEFVVFKESATEEADELDLKVVDLVTIELNRAPINAIIEAEDKNIAEQKLLLDNPDGSGLKKKQEDLLKALKDAKAKLDAPQRAYQDALRLQNDWDEKRSAILGSAEEPESLEGMKAAKEKLAELPDQINDIRNKQRELAEEIHAEKVAQAEVFRKHYGAVQSFIDSHSLASGKLHLEFRADLSDTGFTERLLNLISQNRRGSFMGLDDGRKASQDYVQKTDWDSLDSVKVFLNEVDDALHNDMRQDPPEETQLKDQIAKGHRPEEVYDLLYGLSYLQPRYVLRWEGKELSLLSAGERGTLLLVFYLLIDKSDIPLVIDQPEGNLDNHTIAKVLVECVKETCQRRQVFIVTHNPNLAVVCDAHQVVYAEMDKKDGNRIQYHAGALENPAISKHITDVLEGTRWAFSVRDAKYQISD